MPDSFAVEQPSIDSFDELLTMIRSEPNPCRLLTVLVKAETAYRWRPGGDEEVMADEGLLEPILDRDWAVTPELRWADIVAAADTAAAELDANWQFLMTAVLPGANGVGPAPDDCVPHLDRMIRALRIGADLSSFAFFNREGRPAAVTQAAQVH
jgi:hypothetical protein